jgi:hypothetical protein
MKISSLQAANSTMKIVSLLAPQFWQQKNKFYDSECYFATDNSILAANHKFTAEHTIQQQMLLRCRQLNFGSES